jgi:large subunit ribosomal protein L21
MYAIVDIAGQQFKVEKDQKIFVHRLAAEEGAQVEFDKVLLVDNDGSIQLGMPVVAGTAVSAKVLSHVRGDKVKVFKKKRRKGYQVLNGHRQDFTHLVIEGIGTAGSAPKAEAVEAEAAPKKTRKAAAPKAEESTEE